MERLYASFRDGLDPLVIDDIDTRTAEVWQREWQSSAREHAITYHILRPTVPPTAQRLREDRKRRASTTPTLTGVWYALRMHAGTLKTHLLDFAQGNNICD